MDDRLEDIIVEFGAIASALADAVPNDDTVVTIVDRIERLNEMACRLASNLLRERRALYAELSAFHSTNASIGYSTALHEHKTDGLFVPAAVVQWVQLQAEAKHRLAICLLNDFVGRLNMLSDKISTTNRMAYLPEADFRDKVLQNISAINYDSNLLLSATPPPSLCPSDDEQYSPALSRRGLDGLVMPHIGM